MKACYTALLFIALSANAANGQSYCSPTFLNSCTLWNNKVITIGDIDWALGAADCSQSDYTALSTTVIPGDAVPMTVEAGVWCGCAVWVDLNNDYTFADAENLYYSYVGGDPSYVYDFAITLPASTPAGAYRMRVIAPWGSDGFLSTNTNGYGACGDFQYGNFDDFTINVAGTDAIGENAAASLLSASPNPTAGALTLSTATDRTIEHVTVQSMDGRTVQEHVFVARTATVQLDLSALPTGVYMVRSTSATALRSLRVVKQ